MSKIRTIYLYTFSLLGLVLIIIGSVKLVNIVLKTYLFPKAEQILVYPREMPPKIMPDSEERQVPSKEKEEEFQKKEKESRHQREAAEGLAFLIVGVPIYLYHWRLTRGES